MDSRKTTRVKKRLRSALDMLTFGAGKARGEQRRIIQEIFEGSRIWRKNPNIVGFGLGTRTTNGERLSDWTIKVYVEHKLPAARLSNPVPSLIYVPGFDRPLPMDVEPIGRPRAQGIPRIGTALRGATGAVGSLAGIVKSDEGYFMLGNAHIFGFHDTAPAGEKGIFIYDKTSGMNGDRIGSFERAPLLDSSGIPNNNVDVALGRIESDRVGARLPGSRLVLPAGITHTAFENSTEVTAFGAMSNIRSGTILDTTWRGTLDYSAIKAGWNRVGFFDCVLCDPISRPGDSGALVLNKRTRKILGLIIGGEEGQHSIYCKIGNVMDQLGVTPLTRENVTEGERERFFKSGDTEFFGQASDTSARVTGIVVPVDHPVDDMDTLARTLWGEARGDGEIGMQAVANVVLNRLKRPARFQATVGRVCRQHKQFSCWNERDPNRTKLESVDSRNAAFTMALDVARRAIRDQLPDITSGADHYHHHTISADWSIGHTPCARIGDHVFFNDIS
ncbi:MAG: cell wall hydrolase [Desulfobacterales bacterium]|nr:cell wall hydrolase [Desulfobacterales bacterium]